MLARYWIPKARLLSVRKGQDRQCYTNALRLAERRPPLRYCEGWAVAAEFPALRIPHAWCVTRAGYVVDPTWATPGLAYFGVCYTTRHARQRIEAGEPWAWMKGR